MQENTGPSASFSIRQHTSAFVSIQEKRLGEELNAGEYRFVSIRQHPSAYARIRQHTELGASTCCI